MANGSSRSSIFPQATRPRRWNTATKRWQLYPNSLDIIVSQAGVAQAMKDNSKIVDYAVRGAAVFHSIATQPKPADVSDAEWKSRVS